MLTKNFILAQGLAKLRFACMTAGPNGSLSCNLSLCAPVTIDVSACPSSIFIRVAAAAEKHDFASRSPRSCWHCAQWHSRGCVRARHAFVVLLSNSVHGMSEPGLAYMTVQKQIMRYFLEIHHGLSTFRPAMNEKLGCCNPQS